MINVQFEAIEVELKFKNGYKLIIQLPIRNHQKSDWEFQI